MIREERIFRSIPLWLLRDYLQEIGGQSQGDKLVTGEGWRAQLSPMEPFRLGSLRVGQVKLELEGEPEVLAELMPILEMKTMRAGA